MLSNPQKALIKSAQRQAKLPDEEYREVLKTVTGYSTSTEPRLGDRSCDKILAYLEAIYWRKVDKNEIQHAATERSPFRQPRYWANKNNREENSRDRFMQTDVSAAIRHSEAALAKLGFGPAYCATIRQNVTQGQSDPHAMFCYNAALQRTIQSKEAKLQANPF